MPPRPVELPADAIAELEGMADVLEKEARTWSPRHARGYAHGWLKGMRRGMTDAAASCRRRAARIRKALRERKAARDALALREYRRGKR